MRTGVINLHRFVVLSQTSTNGRDVSRQLERDRESGVEEHGYVIYTIVGQMREKAAQGARLFA